jgi:hypothetical protein
MVYRFEKSLGDAWGLEAELVEQESAFVNRRFVPDVGKFARAASRKSRSEEFDTGGFRRCD